MSISLARSLTNAQLADKLESIAIEHEKTVRQLNALTAEFAELVSQLAAVTLASKDLVASREARVALTRQQAEDAGHVINIGPKGGVFYLSKSGSKVYVKKR